MNHTINDKNQVDAVVNKQDNVSVYLDNAKTTIEFLVDIPSVLSKYIFCCITAEAYDIAAFYSIDESKNQFITAVSESCYKKKNGYIKEIWIKLTSSNKLKEKIKYCEFYQKLINEEPWRELPSLQSLNDCFDYFDVSDMDDVKWNLNAIPLGQRLNSILTNYGIEKYLEDDIFLETNNCFQKLGYKTQYLNICANDSDIYDKLFFRWYCMGEVLDIVLETIFNTHNTQLTKSLYYHLINACKNQNKLAKMVQARYDQMRLYRPGLKNIIFYEEQSESIYLDNEYVEKVEDETLPLGVGEIKYYSEEDYKKLFNRLLTLNLLHPSTPTDKYSNSFDDFRSVFSDGKIKKRLYWYGYAYELAFFVKQLFVFYKGKFKNKRSFDERIANCFMHMKSKKDKHFFIAKEGTLKDSCNNKDLQIKIKYNIETKELIPKDSDIIVKNVYFKEIELLELNFSALIYNQKQLEELENKVLQLYEINFMKKEHLPLELPLLLKKYNEYNTIENI